MLQKSRYSEDDMPPAPSPPIAREISLDGVPQLGSLDRVVRRKSSIERELVTELHKVS